MTNSGTQRAELHKTIWSIANVLRGSVDGWDFKQYVLRLQSPVSAVSVWDISSWQLLVEVSSLVFVLCECYRPYPIASFLVVLLIVFFSAAVSSAGFSAVLAGAFFVVLFVVLYIYL